LEQHSLKRTAKAPENRLGPKRKVVSQPPFFAYYVSFREGTFPEKKTNGWNPKMEVWFR